MPDFKTLQKKYGDVVAYSILLDIERHLHINSSTMAPVDPEARFRSATGLLNNDLPEQMAA